MKRTVIIGDVHGCLHEVLDLFAKVGLTDDDTVWFLGDLIDRGPYPRECVELAMQHHSVLGNHEERLLLYRAQQRPEARIGNPEHKRSMRALDEEHYEWMETLPLYKRLPEYNVVLAHAGCLPDVPLEEQSARILLHAGSIRAPAQGRDERGVLQHGYWGGDPQTWWTSKAPADAQFWTSYYTGTHGCAVFGHTGLDEPLLTEHAIGLDTGCVFGRKLTALILPDWTFVSVKARKTYFNSHGAKKRFEVAPGQFIYG